MQLEDLILQGLTYMLGSFMLPLVTQAHFLKIWISVYGCLKVFIIWQLTFSRKSDSTEPAKIKPQCQ